MQGDWRLARRSGRVYREDRSDGNQRMGKRERAGDVGRDTGRTRSARQQRKGRQA